MSKTDILVVSFKMLPRCPSDAEWKILICERITVPLKSVRSPYQVAMISLDYEGSMQCFIHDLGYGLIALVLVS